jgi:hypothetical protein
VVSVRGGELESSVLLLRQQGVYENSRGEKAVLKNNLTQTIFYFKAYLKAPRNTGVCGV